MESLLSSPYAPTQIDLTSPGVAVSPHNPQVIGRLAEHYVHPIQAGLVKRVGMMRPFTAIEMVSREKSGFPNFLTRAAFYDVIEVVGKGGTSTAYLADCIPLDGSQRQRKIVKVSTDQFFLQAHLLRTFLSPASRDGSLIDHVQGAFTLSDGRNMAIFEPSECDLSHLSYLGRRRPVSFVIRQLVDMANGLRGLHRGNAVHRDVKGPNLLVNTGGSGKVTDFGLARQLPEDDHATMVTPGYGAPFIWSDRGEENRAMNRTSREQGRGRQTKATDVFAFGRTLQLDVINHVVRQLVHKYEVTDLQMQDLRPTVVRQTDSEEDGSTEEYLQMLEEQYGSRLACYPSQDGRFIGVVFQPREIVLQRTLAAIDLLQNSKTTELTQTECEKLRGLAKLAADLQAPTREGLCQALGVDPQRENEGDLLMREVATRLRTIEAIRGRALARSRGGLFPSRLTPLSDSNGRHSVVRTREDQRDRGNASILPEESSTEKKRLKRDE